MDDMDLDLDFSVDKIRDFLNNKLEETRLGNAKLLETLDKRKRLSNPQPKYNPALVDMHPNVWKKLHNSKYVIGVVLDTKISLNDIKLVLKWDCAEPLVYATGVYAEFQGLHDARKCTLVTNGAEQVTTAAKGPLTVTITFKIPTCPDPAHVISGAILCRVQNEEIIVLMPPVSLSAFDYANASLQDYNPRLLDAENLFALISASEKFDMVMITSENWSKSLESMLEIHCGLTKVECALACKRLYLSYKVSGTFDDSLVYIHDSGESQIYFVTVFARDNQSLFALLHHFHSCATGVVFFPRTYYENYAARNAVAREKFVQDFRECMSNEVKFVREFLSGNTTNVICFRDKLAALERETDRMYLKVSNLCH